MWSAIFNAGTLLLYAGPPGAPLLAVPLYARHFAFASYTLRLVEVRRRRYAKNKIELAAAVGLSYRRLLDYFRDANHPEDHSPGKARYDIEAWARFIASRATAHNRGSKNGQYPFSEREQLIIERTRIAISREKFKLGVAKREYLLRDEVNRAIGTANAVVRREIDRAISVELPPRLEGIVRDGNQEDSAAEIRRDFSRLAEAFC